MTTHHFLCVSDLRTQVQGLDGAFNMMNPFSRWDDPESREYKVYYLKVLQIVT